MPLAGESARHGPGPLGISGRDGYAVSHARSSPRAGRIAVLVALAACAAVGGLVLLSVTDSVGPEFLWQEVTKGLVTFLVVAVAGSTLKYLLDEHLRVRERRKLGDQFLLDMLVEADCIHSGVERTRLLMRVQRSPGEYHARMEEIVSFRVRLNTLSLRVNTQWPEEHRDHSDVRVEVEERLSKASVYLRDLLAEYERKCVGAIPASVPPQRGSVTISDAHREVDPLAGVWDLMSEAASCGCCFHDFLAPEDRLAQTRYAREVKLMCPEVSKRVVALLR